MQTEDSSEKTEVKSEDKKASEKSVAETVQPNSAAVNNLRVLENIEVKLTVEVGNTEIKIKDLLRLNEGSVVELDRLAGDPLDILANGTRIAKGEVVMVGKSLVSDLQKLLLPKRWFKIYKVINLTLKFL